MNRGFVRHTACPEVDARRLIGPVPHFLVRLRVAQRGKHRLVVRSEVVDRIGSRIRGNAAAAFLRAVGDDGGDPTVHVAHVQQEVAHQPPGATRHRSVEMLLTDSEQGISVSLQRVDELLVRNHDSMPALRSRSSGGRSGVFQQMNCLPKYSW